MIRSRKLRSRPSNSSVMSESISEKDSKSFEVMIIVGLVRLSFTRRNTDTERKRSTTKKVMSIVFMLLWYFIFLLFPRRVLFSL